MQIKDVMTPLVESVHPDDSLRDAAQKMKAVDVDPMPVTEGNHVVGLLSHDEVTRRAAEDGLSAGSVPVREVMSTDIACCSADETIHDAVQRLSHTPNAQGFTRLPVVAADGGLVGLVSMTSLKEHLQPEPGEGVAAAFAVESVSSLVDFDEDRVDFMNDESFPASDPIPPPSALGPDEVEAEPG